VIAVTIPRLLTLEEVANALRVSPHTVRSWVRQSRLRPVRLCRRLLFDPAEVQRLLEEAR
jgi:excisionase family DNA binding protein